MHHHTSGRPTSTNTNGWILVAAIVGLLAAVLCSGCGDDKKGSNSILAPQTGSLVGTWDLTRVTSEWNGQVYEVPEEIVESDPLVYIFRSDGTGEMHYKNKTYELLWRTQGNQLTLQVSTMGSETSVYSVTSTLLTLEFDVEDEGEVYHISYIFKRL